ncbi:chemotaxis protein CheX [Cellulomonas rhizosphaerae]|uniref:Chemotaxis protein CheX n=1 Tax=Cellulomonas rhizosphaerae TaxID=2293719 RepID=A0A413RRD2_9CELL|nr:chemotaxis protein CheX [Cellulomonas rhizosphaerae]RHA44514.1 chemotaxis protein CheX [Cellulomonas rhizosphaerae]
MTATVEYDQIHAIAQEVFAAMVDGDLGLLLPWDGDLPDIVDALVAWVDLHGEWSGRAVLVTGSDTAHDLARVLLGLDDGDAVSRADLVDAFGEIANVVGGNLKSLLPTPGTLGLPQVGDVLPPLAGAARVQHLPLSWRGRLLVVDVWVTLPTATSEGTS